MNAMTQDFPVTTTEWLVLRCASGRTLSLAAALRDRGAWTPTWKRKRRMPRSPISRIVTEACLPSFVFIPSSQAQDLPEVPSIPFSLMRVKEGRLIRISDRELNPLRKIADKPLLPAHQLPRVGTTVRFLNGAFEGIQGTVLSCTIRCAFVKVEGIANAMQVPPTMLEKVVR